MKITFLLLTIGSLLLSGCKTNYSVSSDYTHEIECMGSEPDGSINLQTWSKGKSLAIALALAEKNVIKEVWFKGIRDGQPGCGIRPILNTPNIRESETDYFNSFLGMEGLMRNLFYARNLLLKIKTGQTARAMMFVWICNSCAEK